MSPRPLFSSPDFQFPIHDRRLPNLEYRISPTNLPFSKSADSLLGYIVSRAATISPPPVGATLPQHDLSSMGGFEPELNLEDPVHLGVEDAGCSSQREDATCSVLPSIREGSNLSRFPHEPSPFFHRFRFPIPDSRFPPPESRVTNIVFRSPKSLPGGFELDSNPACNPVSWSLNRYSRQPELADSHLLSGGCLPYH
jgi:hypothetical protein